MESTWNVMQMNTQIIYYINRTNTDIMYLPQEKENIVNICF